MDEKDEKSLHNEINQSLKEDKTDGKVSIEDINYFTKKVKITSPRSLKAMNDLGINNQNLEYLTFKEYLEQNPELIGETQRMQKLIYNHVQTIRKALISQVKEARKKIIQEDYPIKKRSISSKYRKPLSLENNSKVISKQDFNEKDIKAIDRMKNINKTNLFNRMEMELKKELKNLIINEQEEKNNAKKTRQIRIFEKKMKDDYIKKMLEEEEKEKMNKEIDKKQRKDEEKRIQNLQEEEKEEKELIKQHQKDERIYIRKQKLKQEKYKKKLDDLRDLQHKALVEKNQQKQTKVMANLLKVMKEKKKKRLNSEMNFRKKQKIVEENKKKIEEDIELNHLILLRKQRLQQQKREKEEKRRNRELKSYQLRLISQAKQDDFNMLLKQKSLNETQMRDILNHTTFFNEKEKKQKETLLKNEILLNKRRKDIMDKINERGKNIERTQYERDYYNLLEKEKKVKKKLDKDNKVKLMEQYLINKREELRGDLEERNKKVERFMRNKVGLIHKKKATYEDIMKEKDLDNDKYEKILSKKSLDRKTLHSFKEIFPENDKIDEIINEFNIHLDKKGNSRYIQSAHLTNN